VFGAGVGETTVSGTKAILSNIVDPSGIRMEMAELPPESLHPGDGALAIAFSAYAPPRASLFLRRLLTSPPRPP
jgi:hypothetical protein